MIEDINNVVEDLRQSNSQHSQHSAEKDKLIEDLIDKVKELTLDKKSWWRCIADLGYTNLTLGALSLIAVRAFLRR